MILEYNYSAYFKSLDIYVSETDGCPLSIHSELMGDNYATSFYIEKYETWEMPPWVSIGSDTLPTDNFNEPVDPAMGMPGQGHSTLTIPGDIANSITHVSLYASQVGVLLGALNFMQNTNLNLNIDASSIAAHSPIIADYVKVILKAPVVNVQYSTAGFTLPKAGEIVIHTDLLRAASLLPSLVGAQATLITAPRSIDLLTKALGTPYLIDPVSLCPTQPTPPQTEIDQANALINTRVSFRRLTGTGPIFDPASSSHFIIKAASFEFDSGANDTARETEFINAKAGNAINTFGVLYTSPETYQDIAAYPIVNDAILAYEWGAFMSKDLVIPENKSIKINFNYTGTIGTNGYWVTLRPGSEFSAEGFWTYSGAATSLYVEGAGDTNKIPKNNFFGGLKIKDERE